MIEVVIAETVRPARRWWAEADDAVIREQYGTYRGARKCAEILHRTVKSIHNRASVLGVRGNYSPRPGQVKHVLDARSEELIRKRYSLGLKRGGLQKLANELGKPKWWVSEQATALGVTGTKNPPYSEAEDALLAQWAHVSAKTAANKLRKAGFNRTVGSVWMRRRQVELESTEEHFATTELGRLMGVDEATVRRWIKSGGLPAKRYSDATTAAYKVKRGAFRHWVKYHVQEIDPWKLIAAGSWYWFVDLMAGR